LHRIAFPVVSEWCQDFVDHAAQVQLKADGEQDEEGQSVEPSARAWEPRILEDTAFIKQQPAFISKRLIEAPSAVQPS
jgi:hypothetical protein